MALFFPLLMICLILFVVTGIAWIVTWRTRALDRRGHKVALAIAILLTAATVPLATFLVVVELAARLGE